MAESEYDFYELMGKYIINTLSADEADFVLKRIQQDEQSAELLKKMVRCDWLLRIRYGQVNPSFLPQSDKNHSNETAVSYNSLGEDKELSHLLTWGRNVPALNRNSEPKKSAKSPSVVPAPTTQTRPDSTSQNEEEWDAFAIYKEEEERRAAACKKTKYQWKFSDYVFIANIVLAICLVVAVCLHERSGTTIPVIEETVFPARIVELIHPEWKEGTKTYNRGQWLGFDTVSLQQGMAKIVLADGAEVVLEGPSEFVIRSENGMFLNSGTLSAHVPHSATGFEVVTPFASFIDRGTEFFLDVSPQSTQAVTVKGRIDMKTSHKLVSLTKGKSIAFNGNTVSKPVSSLFDRYISQNSFTQKLMNYVSTLREEKRVKDLELDTDPSLLVRFDATYFDQGSIPNSSAQGRSQTPKMRIIGCSQGEGRWYETKSLLYKNSECYGQFNLPGTYSSMTFVASVQMNKLQNQGNTLLASNDFMKKPGSVFWQITREGKIIFYITSNELKSEAYASPVVFSPGDTGGWFEVAVVLNAKNKTVSHYVNGKRIARVPWNSPIPLGLGEGILGNTLERNYRINNRNWDGAIDELKIFNRAIIPSK